MSTRISRATRNAIFKAAESGNLEEMNHFLDEFGNTKVDVGQRSEREFNIDLDGALIKEDVWVEGSNSRYDATGRRRRGVGEDGPPIYVRLTPLYIAAYNGHIEMVKLLLKNIPPKGLQTALNHQVNNVPGFHEGMQPWPGKIPKSTPLIAAIANDHEHVAEILINATDNNSRSINMSSGGMTVEINSKYKIVGKDYSPIMYAAEKGYLQICKLLIAKGADLSHRTKEGKTAFSVAEKNGHKEVCSLIRKNIPNLFCFDTHPYCNKDNMTCYKTEYGATNKKYHQQKDWSGNNNCHGNHQSVVTVRGVGRDDVPESVARPTMLDASVELNTSVETDGGGVRGRLISKRKKRLFKKKSKRKNSRNTKRRVRKNTKRKNVRRKL